MGWLRAPPPPPSPAAPGPRPWPHPAPKRSEPRPCQAHLHSARAPAQGSGPRPQDATAPPHLLRGLSPAPIRPLPHGSRPHPDPSPPYRPPDQDPGPAPGLDAPPQPRTAPTFQVADLRLTVRPRAVSVLFMRSAKQRSVGSVRFLENPGGPDQRGGAGGRSPGWGARGASGGGGAWGLHSPCRGLSTSCSSSWSQGCTKSKTLWPSSSSWGGTARGGGSGGAGPGPPGGAPRGSPPCGPARGPGACPRCPTGRSCPHRRSAP